MSFEFRIPILGKAAFFSNVKLAALSLAKLGGDYATAPINVSIGNYRDKTAVLAANRWAAGYPVYWRPVPPEISHPGVASGYDRYTFDAQSDVVILMDADACLVRQIDELLVTLARSPKPTVAGMPAHIPPFADRSASESEWRNLLAAEGFPDAALDYTYSTTAAELAGRCPPYFNYGFVAFNAAAFERIRTIAPIYIERTVERLKGTRSVPFSGQIALTFSILAAALDVIPLGFEYNCSNSDEPLSRGLADPEHIRVLHYQSAKLFNRHTFLCQRAAFEAFRTAKFESEIVSRFQRHVLSVGDVFYDERAPGPSSGSSGMSLGDQAPKSGAAADEEDADEASLSDRTDAGYDASPVFVHSSWRTSSTWLWSRLRQAPTAIVYKEVFHERLANCSVPSFRQADYSRWNSKHPQSAPYFLEFAPLIESGGAVRGYLPGMAFERFIPADGVYGDLDAEQIAYLDGLIRHARARRKVPVLTDTRTLGRVRAIAAAFGGRQILLVRNLFHQWGSYSEKWLEGDGYFMDTLFKTVESSRTDTFVRLLGAWFADQDHSPYSPAAFQLFLLFHLYLYAHAYDAVGLVVDVNKLAADADLRAEVEGRLGRYVGSPIDLSGARDSFGLSLFAVESEAVFVETIEQFVKQITDDGISVEAAAFVVSAKEAALSAWAENEFYSGKVRAAALRVRLIELERNGPNRPASEPLQTESEVNESADRLDRLIALLRSDSRFLFYPSPRSALDQPAAQKNGRIEILAAAEGRPVLMLADGDLSASSALSTEGFSIRVPDSFEREASGKTVRIRVVARSSTTSSRSGSARLAVAYSTNEVGNSGWRWFEVKPDWGTFEMLYDVPKMKDGKGDFIGLLVEGGGKPGVLICAVSAAVAAPAPRGETAVP